ncbi:MAG TPA: 30S ribosome-binding factor RbfA [Bacteroidota bacterium]|nr:30S ribosome-binding factor RbfA [Bacteroidota bacterium]
MSVRTEKVASLIKQEMSLIVQRTFRMEEFGFITITDVRMSPDLKIAKVYVSIFGNAEQKEKVLGHLEAEKSSMRAALGHVIRLKFTPSIVFYLDETLDRAMNIENILHRIHKGEIE